MRTGRLDRIRQYPLFFPVRTSQMEFDETALIEFFGVEPVPQDPEEREFFGSSEFEVIQGPFVFRISFSATHSPKVIADIRHSSGGGPVIHLVVNDAAAVRIHAGPQRLVVLAARLGAQSRAGSHLPAWLL